MKYITPAALIFLSTRIFATHIVGGEFEMIHMDSFRYEINLIMYFDEVNGNPEAEDPFVLAYIFRLKDHSLMTSVSLDNSGSDFVPYTNIECAIGELVTRRILYSGRIVLDPGKFYDQDGYYIVSQRCCRNETITNIQQPGATGQAFYLEFPPVHRNGEPFINSSPRLFPPLSDYACVNNFYYVDFAGFDPDGDSLVYHLVQPLAGTSSPTEPLPGPVPAPYPVIQWVEGISTTSAIPGNPSLQINKNGLLTVEPVSAGLFVFSVLCEEFRNGKKIGEVVRDFQMLVIDCPDPGTKPGLSVRDTRGQWSNENPAPFFFSVEDEKCIEFTASDLDGNENLAFHVKSVNFPFFTDNYLSLLKGIAETPSDPVKFKLCLPDCPLSRSGPIIADVIAGDDTCPLPLLDTIRLQINIEPPPNEPARFDTTANAIKYNIHEGELISLRLDAYDPDDDSIRFSVISLNFDTADYHLKFIPNTPEKGKLSVLLNWDSSCKKYDFNDKKDFTLFLLVEDIDFCNQIQPDTIRLDIHVELPPNSPPVIEADLKNNDVEMPVLGSRSFHLTGTDADGDEINMYAYADDFDLSEKGFTTLNATGSGKVEGIFSWTLHCSTVNPVERDQFIVHYVIEDEDKCKLKNADTLTVTFQALLPENSVPELEINGHNDSDFEVYAGDSLLLNITGHDADMDSLELQMDDEGEQFALWGALFSAVNGIGRVSTWFYWKTECEHLGPGPADMVYKFPLTIRDNHCLVPGMATIVLTIRVMNEDFNYDQVFIPNVMTPNDDGYNEYFNVDGLPGDNCLNQFEKITIFNRLGRTVFSSNDRNFAWGGDNINNGIYYYQIKYTHREYKGYIHVLY